ncbi:nucleotidyltransferase domain-containing protein [Microbacterium sp. NPDC012755]|uniref:nucleotidyltransferase domain-containing protein n=1 Tax=Microbacterium sp. NPDC012755 TaxID=3364184 RepID=UPI003682562E
MDLLTLAERFNARNYPDATIAVVGGSTARGERTASSDIDLLLLSGDHRSFADRVDAELERAGGRVRAGFVR